MGPGRGQIGQPTHGLWEKTAPPLWLESYSGSSSTDVVVVGGGYTGLSSALHLRELGVSVTVLEAVDVGFGASGRNVGLVNAGLWLPPEDVVKVLGSERGENLLKLLSHAPDRVFELARQFEMQCEPDRNGTLNLAVGRKGLRSLEARYSQWKRRGAPVELLDARQTRARSGSSRYAGSLLDMRAGTVQPLGYARGLAKAAISTGAQVYVNSAVEKVERIANRWRITTARGQVDADWVIVATDTYSTGAWNSVGQELISLPYFNVATEPLPEAVLSTVMPGRHGSWDTQTVLTSFRTDRAGRLIFGSVGALRGLGTMIHRAFARRAIHTHFPQLADYEFECEWYGSIGMTSDNVPRFHQFDRNIIGFSGYNGRGIAPGTAFGRVLARYVTGQMRDEELPLPVTPLRAASLRGVREKSYEFGAQLAHLVATR
jgi:glycine/D-amino acid oxidase-like deaminating enzyme